MSWHLKARGCMDAASTKASMNWYWQSRNALQAQEKRFQFLLPFSLSFLTSHQGCHLRYSSLRPFLGHVSDFPFFCENCGVRSLIPVKKRSRPVGLRSVRHVPREGLASCTRTPRRFQYTFRNLEYLETVVFPFVNGRQTPSQTAMQQNACLLPSVAPNFATDTAVGNAGRDLVCDWKLRWSV